MCCLCGEDEGDYLDQRLCFRDADEREISRHLHLVEVKVVLGLLPERDFLERFEVGNALFVQLPGLQCAFVYQENGACAVGCDGGGLVGSWDCRLGWRL